MMVIQSTLNNTFVRLLYLLTYIKSDYQYLNISIVVHIFSVYFQCLRSWEETIRVIQGKDALPAACDTKSPPPAEKDEASLEKAESTETDKSDLS